MKILVIIGSTRINRQADRVKAWLDVQLSKRTDASYELVDLRDVGLPFYDEVDSINTLDGKFTHPEGKAWGEKIATADGFIMVTAEYNHGVPAVMKNAIDYGWDGWLYKPLSIVSYSSGPVGGARATEQLRLISQGVKLLPLPMAVHIGRISDAIDETGVAANQATNDALNKLCQELTHIGTKLKNS